MDLIAGLLLAPLFVSLGFSSTLASIASGFVLLAAGILLAFLFAPKPPKPDDGKFAVHQTTPPRGFAYGTARVAGSIMLKINPGNGGTLWQVQALVSHRVNQFVQLYFNDDAVEIDTSLDAYAPLPMTNGGAVIGEEDGRYGWDDSNPRCWVDWHFGVEAETPYWLSSLADVIPFFPTTARGNRIASSAFEFRDSSQEKQAQRYPNGAPDPSWVMDTAFLYDPRDAAQNISNPTTWVFSRNPVLAIMHFLCFSEFGYQREYQDAVLPLEADWKLEADICDELIATAAGGTQKRYELGGQGTTENDPKAILVYMLAACDGWLARRGDGVYVIRTGKFRASGISLEEEDIAGWQYQRGRADEDVINHLDINFTSPSHKYSEVQCDPFDDTADQASRGTVRATPFDLTWVQDWRRARRLGKREWKRQREPLLGSLDLKLSGINAAYERWIYIGDVSIPGLANRYIENRGCGFSLMAGGLKLQFIGTDPSIDDWSTADEGLPPPVIDEQTNELVPPANPDAFIQNFTVGTPPVTAQRIVMDFDQPVPLKEYDYSLRYRVTDEDAVTPGDQPGPFIQERHNETPQVVSGTRYRLKTGAVPSGALLEIQIATIPSKGSYSDYSVLVPVFSDTAVDVLNDGAGNALLDSSGSLLTP